MARTAHHMRPRGTLPGRTSPRPWSPWRKVRVRELRYSADRLRSAAREGRRPMPREVWRTVAVHSVARRDPRGGTAAALASVDERRARQVTRHQIGLLRGGLLSDIEIEPGRHRHGACWHG
jgi:hypothetical protein